MGQRASWPLLVQVSSAASTNAGPLFPSIRRATNSAWPCLGCWTGDWASDAHPMQLENFVDRVVRGRGHAQLAAQLDHVPSKPVELEPIAAFEIMQHRRLEGRWRRLAKPEPVVSEILRDRNPLGPSDRHN